MEKLLSVHLSYLDRLNGGSDATVVKTACVAATAALTIYLPLLGFVARSTSIRNAFEIYGPILRLTRSALGSDKRLILSSEWEYSPFTYVGIQELPEYLLIGLPAPESANPLLLPIAGHELGHSVWRKSLQGKELTQKVQSALVDALSTQYWSEFSRLFDVADPTRLTSDLFVWNYWQPSFEFAKRQLEELFCDAFGIRLFGSAFGHAFAYLLSPNVGGSTRSPHYPNMKRRAKYVVEASGFYGCEHDQMFVDRFEDLPEPFSIGSREHLLLTVADQVVQDFVVDARVAASECADSASLPMPNSDEAKRLALLFRTKMIPGSDSLSLEAILNAGWLTYHDDDLWNSRPEIENRDHLLTEILLKSIEVLEFNAITK
ncbi:MAG: hypothetical protein U0V87_15815 [Acidobacteriota bacterium]